MMQHITRAQIIQTARTWLDTPYQHQASIKFAGCDCLGLVRGIWRELYGVEPLNVPPYTPDWAEISGQETLLNAAQTCLVPIKNGQARPGDLLLFRMQPDAPVKHIAVMTEPDIILHAYWGRSVVESHLVPYWQRRWTHSFSFPYLG